MTQDERREYLIQYLLKEEVRFVRQRSFMAASSMVRVSALVS